jgi:dienelactone hydrolase
MMRLWRWIGIVLLLARSATADVHDAVDLPLNLKGATGQTAEWLKSFAADPATFHYTREAAVESDGLRICNLTFPSPMNTPFESNNSVPAELYLPAHSEGKLPAAIVLDILDGRAILPRMMARALAQRGVAALYFPMPYYNARRPKETESLRQLVEQDPKLVLSPLRQTVMDVRRAKAILATLPEIDAHKIGITGISLGGIMTTLAAGVDGEFYRVAPVLAGGDVATIVFHCREMSRVRKLLIERDVTRDALAALVAPVEPLNFAARIDPRTCLMINADADDVIPKSCTDALRRTIGDPTLLWMPGGHYSAALFLPNVEQKVADLMLGKEVTTLDFDRTAPAR